ncbi:uncharacterized protein KNAG_0A04090 [Huiozyma naganishii CBS 8797]|uniref:Uncharacterized protein n=1 Tax=Huiozyma naganishii (strain ATCC MYA-139 / BCRC 22969 / CBS 8797 / KCTC 17520 / NBRC 10181 / NCYC 3082 / Yp74L-3) TaxID=1071383 RepID=J7REV2_HUIN7|nr:hypothetical protein KNAG_0A04090 [Kazachstania naganishii CBS 8797]CCK68088.1 hypothetical protein KNAG_0A04090 [Kazachstania naganishii CBS 8797]
MRLEQISGEHIRVLCKILLRLSRNDICYYVCTLLFRSCVLSLLMASAVPAYVLALSFSVHRHTHFPLYDTSPGLTPSVRPPPEKICGRASRKKVSSLFSPSVLGRSPFHLSCNMSGEKVGKNIIMIFHCRKNKVLCYVMLCYYLFFLSFRFLSCFHHISIVS